MEKSRQIFGQPLFFDTRAHVRLVPDLSCPAQWLSPGSCPASRPQPPPKAKQTAKLKGRVTPVCYRAPNSTFGIGTVQRPTPLI